MVIFAPMLFFNRCAELLADLFDLRTMGLVDGERLARTADGGKQRLLPSRQIGGGCLFRAADDDGILQIFQNDIAFDRQIKGGGRECRPASAGKTPVVDIIDESRRKALRRIPARHDHALRRIAANGEPCPQVIKQHSQKPAARKQDGEIIPQPPARLLRGIGGGNRTLGQLDCNRHALAHRKRAGGGEEHLVTFVQNARILALRAKRAGEDGGIGGLDALRQSDGRGNLPHRELPAITGDIPGQLVIITEITDLPGGGVGDLEDMFAGRQKTVGAAGIDPDAAINIFGAPAFRRAIALDRNDVEIHLRAAVIRVQRIKRKIAEDAALDVLAFGAGGDGFRHRQLAIRRHLDDGMVGADEFLRKGWEGHAQEDEQREKSCGDGLHGAILPHWLQCCGSAALSFSV